MAKRSIQTNEIQKGKSIQLQPYSQAINPLRHIQIGHSQKSPYKS